MAKNGQSALERIKELDEERNKLLEEAKATALANATTAVEELNALGFNYRLVEGDIAPTRTPRQVQQTGTRRSGIRDAVLDAIVNAGPDGIKPAQIRAVLGIEDGDTGGAQSVSNALNNLRKAGKAGRKNGSYFPA